MRVSLPRSQRLAALTRSRSVRSGAHTRLRPAAPEVASGSDAEQVRARASGGPEDSALYSCECGCAFQARVSASVSCPRCGSTQAW